MALLTLFRCSDRKIAGANRCQVSLHCQLRIAATITRSIQTVLSVERQYTAWNGVILGPFYHCIPSLTIVYRSKLLSFSTWVLSAVRFRLLVILLFATSSRVMNTCTYNKIDTNCTRIVLQVV